MPEESWTSYSYIRPEMRRMIEGLIRLGVSLFQIQRIVKSQYDIDIYFPVTTNLRS
jgi:hypothetical protein